jgi:hypothetical protein
MYYINIILILIILFLYFQLTSPIALFFVNGKHQLVPIAIQLFQEKGDDNPVSRVNICNIYICFTYVIVKQIQFLFTMLFCETIINHRFLIIVDFVVHLNHEK